MIDAKLLSANVLLVAIVALIWQRRRVFRLSFTGVFFLSHVLLIFAGTLLAPWMIDGFLPIRYYYMDWDLITDRHLHRAIGLISVGLAVALIGNVYAELLINGKGPPRGLLLWLRSADLRQLGYSKTRTTLILLVVLTPLAWDLARNANLVVSGMASLFAGGRGLGYYDTRVALQGTQSYLLYILTRNAVPFLALLFYWTHRRSDRSNPILPYVSVLLTIILLLATFEKMHLVLFLGLLTFVHFVGGRPLDTVRRELPAPYLSGRSFYRWILPTMVPLTALAFLYLRTTSQEQWSSSLLLTAEHIVTRLSVCLLSYVSYFPEIEPHYGLTNIGKLSGLLGQHTYHDTVIVLRYFTDMDWGSGAIGAIGDFYGAWGWMGVVLGSGILGFGIRLVDHWLERLPPTIMSANLFVWALVCAAFLPQASVARCLSSYGALWWLVLWLVLREGATWQMSRRLRALPRARPAASSVFPSMIARCEVSKASPRVS